MMARSSQSSDTFRTSPALRCVRIGLFSRSSRRGFNATLPFWAESRPGVVWPGLITISACLMLVTGWPPFKRMRLDSWLPLGWVPGLTKTRLPWRRGSLTFALVCREITWLASGCHDSCSKDAWIQLGANTGRPLLIAYSSL